MDRFIVSAYRNMKSIRDEEFGNTDKCKFWTKKMYKNNLEDMYFEIHHKIGASSYLKGLVARDQKTINWIESEYPIEHLPRFETSHHIGNHVPVFAM